MLLFDKVKVEDITKNDVDEFKYAEVPPDEKWWVGMVKEIVEIRNNNLEVDYFDEEELTEILHYICTS